MIGPLIEDDHLHPLARFDDDRCFECRTPVGGHLRTDSVTYNDYPTFSPYHETEIPGILLCDDCGYEAERYAP